MVGKIIKNESDSIRSKLNMVRSTSLSTL